MPTGNSLPTLALQKGNVLPKEATSLDSFLQELKTALDQHMLSDRAIKYLFSDASPFHPTCTGDWMEFGVFNGDTINFAAKARQATCGETCPPVFGFDTFTGTTFCCALFLPGTCNPLPGALQDSNLSLLCKSSSGGKLLASNGAGCQFMSCQLQEPLAMFARTIS